MASLAAVVLRLAEAGLINKTLGFLIRNSGSFADELYRMPGDHVSVTSPVSPVRILIEASTGVTMILPSPISPVCALALIASIT